MGFFDELTESLTTAGRDVSQKAKEVSEIAKLKLDIKSKEDYVQKQYAALGAAYFEKHKDEEGIEEAEQFFLIKEALGEIERMRAEVLKLQGAAECPKCGVKMPEGATFCSNCGAKMNDMYEEE
ncbi:MAG: zinc ribbon domain-containing protein [Clostridiales bacterium]|nr:zinc ribbon domain-containing protein [Roseburia sp.]MDD7636023.1 zinc ribbon domain-containing protein [Clostridiales bacterium]MDY4113350.1 zinc ribbon domain-containing protein [Roseburia sp.]